MVSLETRSRDVQEKTFCKWCVFLTSVALYPALRLRTPCRLNTKLEAHGYPPMTSLVKDLSDGVRLIQLMVRNSDILPGMFIEFYCLQEIMGM